MLANIIHAYGAQIFLALAGLISMPFLLEMMGAELYSFVAIFFTIQVAFSILDGGLSGSLAREFALKRSSERIGLSAKELVRKAEFFYYAIATFGFGIFYAFSEYIATKWIKTSDVSHTEAQAFIVIIGAISAIRLASGLYRSILIGYEKQKQLSYINILSTVIRFFIILPIIYYIESKGYFYFYYQLGATFIEVVILKVYANIIIPNAIPDKYSSRNTKDEILNIFQKSFQIWILSFIWVASTQIDKILLSGKLLLGDFAYFSVVSSLVSGLLMLGTPITSAAMPRMSIYYKSAAYDECEKIYFRVSEILALIAFPISLTLIASPNHAIFLLTNNALASNQYSFILACYSFGSLMLVLAGLTFLLQYSAGNLNRNIYLNSIYLVLLAPVMAVSIHYWAAKGAAVAWLTINIILITIIIRPLNALPTLNFHNRWLVSFVFKPLVVSSPSLVAAIYLMPKIETRLYSLLWLLLTFIGIGLPLVALFFLRLNKIKR